MKKLISTFLLAFLSLTVFASEPLWQGKGRIVISSDGNEHDDDDWAATTMSLAILASEKLQDKLSLYVYSDHVWGSSHLFPNRFGMSAYEHMKESALGGKKWFNFKKSEFLCGVDDPEAAYNAMAREINKSSEKNPLFIIGAGPMQVIGEGLNRSDKAKHKFVTIISHSNWNNGHAKSTSPRQPWDQHTGWTWTDMKKTFTGINYVMIRNQNGGKDYPGLFNPREKYDWIKTSPARNDKRYKKGAWDFLYKRVEACQKRNNKYFDVSDAGMVLFLLTGDDIAAPEKLEKFMTEK